MKKKSWKWSERERERVAEYSGNPSNYLGKPRRRLEPRAVEGALKVYFKV